MDIKPVNILVNKLDYRYLLELSYFGEPRLYKNTIEKIKHEEFK